MDPKSLKLAGPLKILPPVEFCCVYGSSLVSNNNDKTSMVDYILGVLDPIKWHSENLERNSHHYSKLMATLGPKAVTCAAERIGVGVHVNSFVEWRDKMIKYGVVGMQELARDVLTWERFYLSGRLQKPVKKIVHGSFQSFRSMYKPLLQEYAAEGLLNSHSNAPQELLKKDCGLSASNSLFCSLPSTIMRRVKPNLGLKHESIETGTATHQILISSGEEAANCIRKAL